MTLSRYLRIVRKKFLAWIALAAIPASVGCEFVLGLDGYRPVASSTGGETGADGGGNGAEGDAKVDGPPVVVCGGTTCKPHEECSVNGQCSCTTGYVQENGNCVFRGGPRDPSLSNQPASWTLSGGASLDPQAATGFDPGIVRLPAGGSLSQLFDMPEARLAEPLALVIMTRDTCGPAPTVCPGPPATLEAGFAGASQQRSPARVGFEERRVCLGELSFGKGAGLELRAFNRELLLDRAGYVSDSTCPMPGEVRNGDFEGNEGWVAQGNAEVASGLGTAGSRAARIGGLACEDYGVLSGAVSVPAALTSPALRFAQKGNAISARRMNVAGAHLLGKPAYGLDTVCLPAWSRGLAIPIAFGIDYAAPPCSGATFIIDDVTLVSSPSCGQGFLFDGDFESTISYWEFGNGGFLFSSNLDNNHSASVSNQAYAWQTITVPPAVGAAGPAVTFTYSLSGERGDLSYDLTVAGKTLSLRSGDPKPPGRVCLPPARIGKSFLLSFTGGPGANAGVDDVKVGTDVVCPVK